MNRKLFSRLNDAIYINNIQENSVVTPHDEADIIFNGLGLNVSLEESYDFEDAMLAAYGVATGAEIRAKRKRPDEEREAAKREAEEKAEKAEKEAKEKAEKDEREAKEKAEKDEREAKEKADRERFKKKYELDIDDMINYDLKRAIAKVTRYNAAFSKLSSPSATEISTYETNYDNCKKEYDDVIDKIRALNRKYTDSIRDVKIPMKYDDIKSVRDIQTDNPFPDMIEKTSTTPTP